MRLPVRRHRKGSAERGPRASKGVLRLDSGQWFESVWVDPRALEPLTFAGPPVYLGTACPRVGTDQNTALPVPLGYIHRAPHAVTLRRS